MSTFRKLAERQIWSGHLIKVAEGTFESPDGDRFERELVHHPGAVVVVSHDRYFVDALQPRILEVNEGRLVERHSAVPSPPPPSRSRTKTPSARGTAIRNSASKGGRRRPPDPEAVIRRLEEERSELTRKLADPSTYRTSSGDGPLVNRLRAVEAELESAYAAWVELDGSTDR